MQDSSLNLGNKSGLLTIETSDIELKVVHITEIQSVHIPKFSVELGGSQEKEPKIRA